MLLFLLICNILFIPIIHGSNSSTTLKVEHSQTKTKEITEVESGSKRTNFTIILEGGSKVESTSSISLLKGNRTNLLSLEKDLDIEKSVQSTGSKVTPRKGVPTYPGNNSTIDEDSIEIKQRNNINIGKKLKDTSATQIPQLMETKVLKVVHKNNMENNKTLASFKEKINQTESHKKPTVLSSEALDKMPIVLSSVNTKTKQKQNRHPGMVMPVVLTILVVPMFAVLAYMALRRGQEAWKNRHYKRMDFLLDDMANRGAPI